MSKDKNIKAPLVVQALPELVEKKQNITIVFNRYIADEPPAQTFFGIVGHQVGQQWVAVMLKEDETVLFPSSLISEIRVWKE